MSARLLASLTALVVCCGTLASCTEDDTAETTETTAPTTTLLQLDPDAVTDDLVLPPGVINPLGPYNPVIYSLETGACFTLLTVTLGQTVTEYVTGPPCDGEHESEMYFTIEHPAGRDERYPGEDELRAWALDQCYTQFEPFVGQIYELSTLEIGFSMPPRENWEDPVARFRKVSCWVSDVDEELLVGSMRGSAR